MYGGGWVVWVFNTELVGISTFRSRAAPSDGAAMAWRAGTELTMMEKSGTLRLETGYKRKWYGGAGDASYRNLPLVDDNGKELPVQLGRWDLIREGVLKGKYALPFYRDFPSMPEKERKITWGMMLDEESTTSAMVKMFNQAGFDRPGTCSRTNANWKFVPCGIIMVSLNVSEVGRFGVFCPGKAAVAPTGNPIASKVTGELNSLSEVTFTVDVVEPLGDIIILVISRIAVEKCKQLGQNCYIVLPQRGLSICQL